jgi:membrane protease YdiL (CAAX protease family)
MTTAPERPLPLRGWDLVLILALTFVTVYLIGLLLAPVGAALNLSEAQDAELMTGVQLLLLAAQTAILLFAIYLVAVRWRGMRWAEFGLRPARRIWYLRAFAIAPVALFITGGLNLMIQELLGDAPTNPQFTVIAPAGFSWLGLIGMLIMVGGVMPFAEELLFRGLFYRWLRERCGTPAAVTASALLFSLLHGIPWLVPALAVVGAVLALVYEKSGSLWVAVLVHGLFNSTGVLVIYGTLAGGGPLT